MRIRKKDKKIRRKLKKITIEYQNQKLQNKVKDEK